MKKKLLLALVVFSAVALSPSYLNFQQEEVFAKEEFKLEEEFKENEAVAIGSLDKKIDNLNINLKDNENYESLRNLKDENVYVALLNIESWDKNNNMNGNIVIKSSDKSIKKLEYEIVVEDRFGNVISTYSDKITRLNTNSLNHKFTLNTGKLSGKEVVVKIKSAKITNDKDKVVELFQVKPVTLVRDEINLNSKYNN